MKCFLFLSKILAGCAFFSNYHARNNLWFLGSTNVIATKKMVSYKKFPTLGLKFCDIQKKSVQSCEKAADAVCIETEPETFFQTFKSNLKFFSKWYITFKRVIQGFKWLKSWISY